MTNTQLGILILVIKFLAGTCLWFARNMHKEGVKTLGDLKTETQGLRNDIQGLTTSNALHNAKLEEGQKQFDRIEGHQKEQDHKIESLSEKIDNKHHTLNNRVQSLELKVSKLEK